MKRIFLTSAAALPLLFAGCDRQSSTSDSAAKEPAAPQVQTAPAPVVVAPTLTEGSISGDELSKMLDITIEKWQLKLPAGRYKLNLYLESSVPGAPQPTKVELKSLSYATFAISDHDNDITLIMRLPAKGNNGRLFIQSENRSMGIPLAPQFAETLLNSEKERPMLFSKIIKPLASSLTQQKYQLAQGTFSDVGAANKAVRSLTMILEVDRQDAATATPAVPPEDSDAD